MDKIMNLDLLLIEKIGSYLEFKDIINYGLVCKHNYEQIPILLNDNMIYYSKLLQVIEKWVPFIKKIRYDIELLEPYIYTSISLSKFINLRIIRLPSYYIYGSIDFSGNHNLQEIQVSNIDLHEKFMQEYGDKFTITKIKLDSIDLIEFSIFTNRMMKIMGYPELTYSS